MEQLTVEQEIRVERFAEWLGSVTGPWDLFPPDETGSREPIPEPRPKLPALQQSIGEIVLDDAIENTSRALVYA